MEKLRIFVSSVQKELENERIAITELVSSDPFLGRHVEACLPKKTREFFRNHSATDFGRIRNRINQPAERR